jgi:hypothetical protein
MKQHKQHLFKVVESSGCYKEWRNGPLTLVRIQSNGNSRGYKQFAWFLNEDQIDGFYAAMLLKPALS